MKFKFFKKKADYPKDFLASSIKICEDVKEFTMTGKLRVNALIEAVKYVTIHNIEGAFVECGVWKGGSSMAMALALKNLGVMKKAIYMYDTFGGMTEPTTNDVSLHDENAVEIFEKLKLSKESSSWCSSSLEEVKSNMKKTGYPESLLNYVVGPVEKTIPKNMPSKISILRLDTDWYESTKHELNHLFPLLSVHGVLIIDDYGYWKGSRKAVDEYFTEKGTRAFLNRIDHSCRVLVKV